MTQPPTSMKAFLDGLLGQGKVLAQRGEDLAAARLGYGTDAEDRQKLRNTALASGAAAGVLGLLLGSKGGRKLAGNAVVLGGLGMLGKLAYDAYRNRGGTAPQAPAADELAGPEAEARAIALTRALIAAARADGHIDADERATIDAALDRLPAGVRGLIAEELNRPLDAIAIARLADSDQAAREIYAASLAVTGDDDPAESAYLEKLSVALRLDAATVAELRGAMGRA